jgi:hypothetical protein
MSRTITAATLFLLFGIGSSIAQGSCATRAMSEDGKPLAGPARTSFMKKCCEDSARDRDGKPLEGDAKASYLERCQGSFSQPDGRG